MQRQIVSHQNSPPNQPKPHQFCAHLTGYGGMIVLPSGQLCFQQTRKLMLHTISWQQYITAVLLVTAAWYTYVGLRYYKRELQALFHPKAEPSPLVAAAPIHAVMGGIQPGSGTETINAEELIFGPGQPDDISDATLTKGPMDDLLAEAETLISAFTETGAKADFLSLLQILLDRYELYRDEISLPAISAALRQQINQLPFELNDSDLELRWPVENYA